MILARRNHSFWFEIAYDAAVKSVGVNAGRRPKYAVCQTH